MAHVLGLLIQAAASATPACARESPEKTSNRQWQHAHTILHEQYEVRMQNIEHNVRVYSST